MSGLNMNLLCLPDELLLKIAAYLTVGYKQTKIDLRIFGAFDHSAALNPDVVRLSCSCAHLRRLLLPKLWWFFSFARKSEVSEVGMLQVDYFRHQMFLSAVKFLEFPVKHLGKFPAEYLLNLQAVKLLGRPEAVETFGKPYAAKISLKYLFMTCGQAALTAQVLLIFDLTQTQRLDILVDFTLGDLEQTYIDQFVSIGEQCSKVTELNVYLRLFRYFIAWKPTYEFLKYFAPEVVKLSFRAVPERRAVPSLAIGDDRLDQSLFFKFCESCEKLGHLTLENLIVKYFKGQIVSRPRQRSIILELLDRTPVVFPLFPGNSERHFLSFLTKLPFQINYFIFQYLKDSQTQYFTSLVLLQNAFKTAAAFGVNINLLQMTIQWSPTDDVQMSLFRRLQVAENQVPVPLYGRLESSSPLYRRPEIYKLGGREELQQLVDSSTVNQAMDLNRSFWSQELTFTEAALP